MEMPLPPISNLGLRGLLLAILAVALGLPALGESPADSQPLTENPPAAVAASDPSIKVAGDAAPPGQRAELALPTGELPVRHVGPDTFILLDKDGNPQPFLGFPYEVFMRAWQKSELQQGDTIRKPRFIIEALEINGSALGSYAKLQVTVRVTLLTEQRIAVPLSMAGAIVRPESLAKQTRAGMQISSNERQGGLVAWIQGQPGDQREVTLQVIVPLEIVGSETILRFNCPRAVASEIAIEIADSVVAEATTGQAIVSKQKLDNGNTLLKALGFGNEFELRWRGTEAEPRELASVLQAGGVIHIHVDSRSVRTSAKLVVESFGGKFDRFQVRLPPGAALVGALEQEVLDTVTAYAVIPIDAAPSPTGAPHGEAAQVLVKLKEPQKGPVTVTLETEQSLRLSGSDLTVAIGGFEVLGAFRQYGDVGISVDDDWQLRWEQGVHIRQVDVSDVFNAVAAQDLTATFQYDRQPWSLETRILPRDSQVYVTPKYQLSIGSDEARLRAEFNYHIPGARIFEFRTKLQEWQEMAAPVEPDAFFSNVLQTEDGELILQLRESSPRSLQVVLQLRKDLPVHENRLKLPLPIPVADVVIPGQLVINSVPAIALSPRATEMTGLAPEFIPVSQPMPEKIPGNERRVFRVFLPEATFVADRTIRARELQLGVHTAIEAGIASCSVEQLFHYRSRYQPMQRLILELPTDRNGDPIEPQFELLQKSNQATSTESVPLEFIDLVEDNDAQLNQENRKIQLLLPQPQLGQFEVRSSFCVDGLTVADNSAVRRVVPLIKSIDGELTNHRLLVNTPSSLKLLLGKPEDSAPWRAESQQRNGTWNELHAVTGESVSKVVLVSKQAEQFARLSTIVEKSWFQTWFAGDLRQDRTVYQFRTREPNILLEFPAGVASTNADVLLDGQPIQLSPAPSGPISVPIPANAGDSLHTLEITCRKPAPIGIVERFRIAPPVLVGGQATNQVVWHFVLPGNTCLMTNPENLMPARRHVWWGSLWFPPPVQAQAEIENWIGSVSKLTPTSLEKQYLFYGLESVASLDLPVVKRSTLVLFGSLLVLLVGLPFIYVPKIRNTRILVVVAVAIGVLAFSFPSVALQIAQITLLGIAGLALAAMLRWALRTPRQRYIGGNVSTAAIMRPSTTSDTFSTPMMVGTSTGGSSVSGQVSDSHS
jgi:hypothetical protein